MLRLYGPAAMERTSSEKAPSTPSAHSCRLRRLARCSSWGHTSGCCAEQQRWVPPPGSVVSQRPVYSEVSTEKAEKGTRTSTQPSPL